MMYLALTYDHRLLDGREAVTFLVKVCHIRYVNLFMFANPVCRSKSISRIPVECCWVKQEDLIKSDNDDCKLEYGILPHPYFRSIILSFLSFAYFFCSCRLSVFSRKIYSGHFESSLLIFDDSGCVCSGPYRWSKYGRVSGIPANIIPLLGSADLAGYHIHL